jgi:hypothetical protein
MGLLEAFGFKNYAASSSELPDIYPFPVEYKLFVDNDLIALFSKILTDCIERSEGVPESIQPALWDNCLASENAKGLITLMSEAMANRAELFLIYKAGVLRKATNDEAEQIKKDYEARAFSALGVYISFKNYRRSEMLRIYSAMEFAVLNSLNKSMNLAKAIQLKMSKMRDSVGLVDKDAIVEQAQAIAQSLACGKDVLLDGEDKIETSVPDMDPTQKAIGFLDAKRAFITCLPLSYITGEQATGIGSTGQADAKAVERGLLQYWVSIIKPVLKELFGVTVTFKSQDFALIDSATSALTAFEATGDDILSLENKRLVISQLLGTENDMEGKPREVSDGNNSGSQENTFEDSSENQDQETINA